jgi:hypothetical protein
MKDVQATGEAFSPQKRTSSTSKPIFFLFLWVIFALLDPDPEAFPMRIRIQPTKINPDPQHWFSLLSFFINEINGDMILC